MKRYRLSAELQSPVAVKRDRQSERSEGVRCLAGTLVRGALAAAYLQRHGSADERFCRLFLNEGACRFGPLDPAPRTFPLTAAACKREPLRHGRVDQLWFRVAQHWVGGALSDEAEQAWRQCRQCGADLKAHTGFWRDAAGELPEGEHDRHVVAAHVGIDRATGTAAESVFYTLEALAPTAAGESLAGWLEADDQAYGDLSELLAAEDHVVYIGHHRTRGYGRVRLTLEAAAEPAEPAALVADWDAWSAALIEFLNSPPFAFADLDPGRDFFFSLTFPAGAVLLDDLLRYTLDPAAMETWLPPLPDPADGRRPHQRPWYPLAEGGELQCLAAVTRHERIRGWNAAHGLPRQDEWAVQRGAVYAYWFRGPPDARMRLGQRLERLGQAGLGVRRNEGFGRIEVGDDFHRRFSRQEEPR